MKVKHLNITENMTISEFITQLDESGVLGAGRIAHATNLLADSMKDPETKIFLSLAGPMVPGGLRKVVRDLVKNGYVDLIISSPPYVTSYEYTGCLKDKIKKADLLPLKKVPFESIETYIPANNDEFLKKVYGDYMQIPPVEKRVNHAPLVIQFEGEEPIYGE